MATTRRLVKRVTQAQASGPPDVVIGTTLVTTGTTTRDIENTTYQQDIGGPSSPLTVTATSDPDNPVPSDSTVRLTATADGGTGTLHYAWTPPTGAPAVSGVGRAVSVAVPAGTPAGTTWTYTVTVTDTDGNTASAAVRIGIGIIPPQPTPLTATITANPASATPGTKVTLHVAPGGGTPPYAYVWSGSAGAPALTGNGTSTVTLTIPALSSAKTWTYTCTMRDAAGNPQTLVKTVKVTGQPVVTGGSWPGLQVKTIVGLNVDQPSQWDSRMAGIDGVGKIKARRIFGGNTVSPTAGIPSGKRALIDEALNDNMLPVFSYKVSGLSNAEMDKATEVVGDQLEALGEDVTVSYHHEPRGDMAQALFVERQKRFMPMLNRPNVSRGPILNGFLSESQWTEYESWSPDELMNPLYWDWFGADCYQQGSLTSPASPLARRRMERTRAFLDSRGYTDWKILVGETNGYSAASITDCMSGVYDPANGIWCACMWDSGGLVLTGDRITAFANALDDPRRY